MYTGELAGYQDINQVLSNISVILSFYEYNRLFFVYTIKTSSRSLIDRKQFERNYSKKKTAANLLAWSNSP